MFNKVRTSFRWVKNTPLPADKATKKLIRALQNDLDDDLLLKEVFITMPDRTVKETAVIISLEERPDTSLFGNSASGRTTYRRMTDLHTYRTNKDGYGHMDFPDINGDWCHDEKRPGGVAAWFDTKNPRNYQDLIFRQLTKAGIRPDFLDIIRHFWDFDPLLEPLEEETEEDMAFGGISKSEDSQDMFLDRNRHVLDSSTEQPDDPLLEPLEEETKKCMALPRISLFEDDQDMFLDRNGHVLDSGTEQPDDPPLKPLEEEIEKDMDFGEIPQFEDDQDMILDGNRHVLASGTEQPDDPLLEPLKEKTEKSPALPRIPFRPEHVEGINYDVLRPVTRSGQNVTDLSFGHTFYDEEDMVFGRIPRPEGAQDMVWDKNGHILASGAKHPDDLFVEPFDMETLDTYLKWFRTEKENQ